jgi:CRISPR-associated protein Cas1
VTSSRSDAAARFRSNTRSITLPDSEDLNVVLGIEGQAAKRYVSTWRHLITDHAQLAAPDRRMSRPPTDPINAALSFGYGMLRIAVHGALEHVGLDPYIGYLHGIRPGKPALALDLMEELRPLLVDRTVFTAVNRRQLQPQHFAHHPGGACELNEDGRRHLPHALERSARPHLATPRHRPGNPRAEIGLRGDVHRRPTSRAQAEARRHHRPHRR